MEYINIVCEYFICHLSLKVDLNPPLVRLLDHIKDILGSLRKWEDAAPREDRIPFQFTLQCGPLWTYVSYLIVTCTCGYPLKTKGLIQISLFTVSDTGFIYILTYFNLDKTET